MNWVIPFLMLVSPATPLETNLVEPIVVRIININPECPELLWVAGSTTRGYFYGEIQQFTPHELLSVTKQFKTVYSRQDPLIIDYPVHSPCSR